MRTPLAVAAGALAGVLPGFTFAQQVSIDFDELPSGTTVAGQYAGQGVTFGAASGYVNMTWDALELASSPNNYLCTAESAGGFVCNQGTVLVFPTPVRNLSLVAVGDVCDGISAIARVTHEGGIDEVELLTDGELDSTHPIDLSDFDQVTKLELTDFGEGCGLGWDDFQFDLIPVAKIESMQSCVVNHGVLASSEGLPAVGSVFKLQMDQAQAIGAKAYLPISVAPDPGWPSCGTATPAGELLISVAGPGPVMVAGGGVFWDGAPVEFSLYLPEDPTLIGASLYAQGLFVDVTGAAPAEPLRLTGGLILEIGE
ncbi:MAG: hypothetical protein AAF682_21115 [Planctomycetota bacterium]